jgi:DNA processing protein
MKDIETFSTHTQIHCLLTAGGLTSRAFDSLLTLLGSPEAILKAGSSYLASIDGMTDDAADRIAQARKQLDRSQGILEELHGRDIRTVSRLDPEFSDLLFELNDPPALLYIRGRLPDSSTKSVTLIGTHEASEPGIALTTSLAQSFAEAGVQVVSSLRGGTDVAAHLGAISQSKSTFAVLDCGFDKANRPDIVPVAVEVARAGGVISEYPPDTDYDHQTIMASNRILVGLGQAVVVTEVYGDSARTLDLLSFCRTIGKMAFIVVDPETGALADEVSLQKAVEFGALPLKSPEAAAEITRVLV